MLKKLLLLSTLITISSCTTSKIDNKLTEPDELYNNALMLTEKNQYVKAAEKFEQLEREHPTSDLATQAQVKRAYVLYLDGKFDEAVLIINEFVKQYPAHQVTPYMLYLKGLCYYDQILDVERDQELTHKAIQVFRELISRFSSSKYSKDAQLKIDYAYNTLAGKEMSIGRFYLTRNEIIAASNRFKNVVDHYESSIFIDEALYRLCEIYYNLGDLKQATNYASVLSFNYPNSKWYKNAYNLLN